VPYVVAVWFRKVTLKNMKRKRKRSVCISRPFLHSETVLFLSLIALGVIYSVALTEKCFTVVNCEYYYINVRQKAQEAVPVCQEMSIVLHMLICLCASKHWCRSKIKVYLD